MQRLRIEGAGEIRSQSIGASEGDNRVAAFAPGIRHLTQSLDPAQRPDTPARNRRNGENTVGEQAGFTVRALGDAVFLQLVEYQRGPVTCARRAPLGRHDE